MMCGFIKIVESIETEFEIVPSPIGGHLSSRKPCCEQDLNLKVSTTVDISRYGSKFTGNIYVKGFEFLLPKT